MRPSTFARNLRNMASAVESAQSPDRAKVAAGMRKLSWWASRSHKFFVRRAVRYAASPEVEGKFEWLEPIETHNGEPRSQLLWHAMLAMDIGDWSLDTNLEAVKAKMAEIGAQSGVSEDEIAKSQAYADENFTNFKKLVESGDDPDFSGPWPYGNSGIE